MKKLVYILIGIFLVSGCDSDDSSQFVLPDTGGQGGSLARFTIAGNILYVVSDVELKAIDISNPSNLEVKSSSFIGYSIETIFARGNQLFIGSNDAMYIYDISQPNSPELLGTYSHQAGCDPVVVQGNYAYVSLRGVTDCRIGQEDFVDKVDISDLSNPSLEISTNDVLSPFGLGVYDNVLYVCQGENGIRLFNTSDLKVIKDIPLHAYDIIINYPTLIVTGNDGIYQYDISDPVNPEFLSLIKTTAL